jgi:hypothetical protein
MTAPEMTYGVPPSKVDQLIEDYGSIGATATKALQKDGTYTVTAVFAGPVRLAPLAMVNLEKAGPAATGN